MMSAVVNQNMDAWKSNEEWKSNEAMSDCEFHAKQRKCTKKNVVRLVIPFKTYKDELRDKYRESSGPHSASENINTRMCNSLDSNQPCFHGDKCKFAHSLEELVSRDCNFKDRCRFVKFKGGKLINEGSNVCRNKHPQEDQDNFIKRTGLSRYKTTAPKHEEIDVEDTKHDEEIVVEDTKHDEKHEAIDVDFEEEGTHEELIRLHLPTVKAKVIDEVIDEVSVGCPTNYWATKTPEPVKFTSFEGLTAPAFKPASSFKFGGFTALPPTHACASMKFEGSSAFSTPLEKEKEILLRVPKVLAMQALELAMNSGNRCIRVEVIE